MERKENSRSEENIRSVIKSMTLEEKTAMIHGAGLFRTGAVERLQIPSLKMSDGPMGVRNEFCNDKWIPNGNTDDYVTYCPSNSAIAATWNRKLAKASGSVLGEEARGRGKDVILAPGINIKRLPACGRNFEYFSEDPYLTAELAVPMVEGIEENDVAACVKHFALNNQETERLWVNVEIDDRTLREIYLPAFEAVLLKAKARSVMSAYNLYRGTHCSCNEALLMDILRKEWAYDGVVISDWGGVHDTVETAEGALDIEMSVTPDFDEYFLANPLIQAVHDGKVSEDCIDEKVYHILQLMIRLHMIEIQRLSDGAVKVSQSEERKAGAYNTSEHREKVLEAARESIVLLKNENMRLPLQKKGLKRVLVIGENAARLQALGGGSAEIKALYEITPLMGIKRLLGGNCQVEYTPGYYVPSKEQQDTNWQENSLNEQEAASYQKQKSEEMRQMEEKLRKEAVELAAGYDEVIYVGGLNHDYDVEGMDRKDLTLPYEQDTLIKELLKVRPDMVIVMMAGSPVAMGSWLSDAKALLWCSYCGMEGGTALTEVIFGDVNPSGKLAESLPYQLKDCGITKEIQFPGDHLRIKKRKR